VIVEAVAKLAVELSMYAFCIGVPGSMSKYGGMDVSAARRPKYLESANSKLHKLLVEAHLGIHALKGVFGLKR
jgi:hypothetical protein